MKILIIHPEGGVNYNTNLAGLLEVLTQAGHLVTYVAPRRPLIHQHLDLPGLSVVLVDRQQVHGRFLHPESEGAARWTGHDLVLAVDRGIVEGDWIARRLGIPKALLSYEIFFQEETPAEVKAQEIAACKDLLLAICQDPLRARKLCLANEIAPEKIFLLPVAGRGFRQPPVPKPRLLHRQFELPGHTRVALYMGSFADWTGASYLLKSTWHWPEDWTLVIHERFGRPIQSMIDAEAKAERVRVSATTFTKSDEMTEFIQSADLGLALYCPTYETEWVGRNIQHIGLASGKISHFLQLGVPVATHELGEISDWIRFYQAGQVFSLDEPFVPALPGEASSSACRALFERHLDLDRFAPALLDTLSRMNQLDGKSRQHG